MFDIGWSEILIIAAVAIVVVGPKDLPRMLRKLGQNVGKLKRMAADFRSQFDDAMRDSELQELRASVDGLRANNPLKDIGDPLREEIDAVNRITQEPLIDESASDSSTSQDTETTEETHEPARESEDTEMAEEAQTPPVEAAEPEPKILAATPPERTAAGGKSGA